MRHHPTDFLRSEVGITPALTMCAWPLPTSARMQSRMSLSQPRSHFCLPSWISVGIPQPQPQPQPRDTPATKENYGMLLSSLHRKQLSKPCHTKVDGDPGAAGIILDLLISSAREGLLSLPSRKAGESTSWSLCDFSSPGPRLSLEHLHFTTRSVAIKTSSFVY